MLQSRNDSPGSESSVPEVISSEAEVPVGEGVAPLPAVVGPGVAPEVVGLPAGEGEVCAVVRWSPRRRLRATARATTVYLGDSKRRNIIAS